MGLAASQARFLQLTARRTNIEYMGQQINQERLALANASAGLFEKMLTLVPPTPPSSQDDKYYTQGYNFTDPADELQKKISWVSTNDASAPASTGINVTSTFRTNGAPALAPGDVGWITAADPAHTIATPVNIAGFGQASSVYTLTYADLAIYSDGETTSGTDADLTTLMNGLGVTPTADTYRSVMRYVTVEHNIYDPDGNYQTVKRQAPAILEFDNLERLLNVTFLDDLTMTATNANAGTAGSVTGGTVGIGSGGAGETTAGLTYSFYTAGTNGTAAASLADLSSLAGTPAEGKTIGAGEKLTYTGVFDQVAFGNDMNKYEFQKAAYDYQIERINSQTKQVQAQDKSLELKMKQLDTEHNAVQTEMEAVQKVIQKNIESSFKTFA